MASDSEGNLRLPPQNLDAEKSVLGSMLRNNLVTDEVVTVVHEGSFYSDAHRKIFSAIVKLYNDRTPVDLVTLAEYLTQQKQIEDVGGYGNLAELWDAAPTAANAVHYARIVRDKGLVRALINIGTEIVADAYDQNMPAPELLEEAEKKIFHIAQEGTVSHTVSLQEALHEVYQRIDSRSGDADPNSISGLPTGYVDLDAITAGLQKSELIIVAARPSVGKTSFALNLVRHMIVNDHRGAFFVSLEQSRSELAARLLCCQARVDSQKLRKGYLSADDMQKLLIAGDELRTAKLFIDDTPSQGMLRIAANSRRLMMKEKLDIVVVDYLQLIDPDNRRESRQEQVANISRRLKFLARELAIPVIALAQVNRSSEDRQDHRPRLADLRESGSIEQDADTVMMLHRPDSEPGQDSVIEVIVAKQRNGPTDQVTLTFVKQFMRFENFAPEPPVGYNL